METRKKNAKTKILEHTWKETLRLGVETDFVLKIGEKKQRNLGAVFFLESKSTGQIEGPYLITQNRNMHEFKKWLVNEMVWVRG